MDSVEPSTPLDLLGLWSRAVGQGARVQPRTQGSDQPAAGAPQTQGEAEGGGPFNDADIDTILRQSQIKANDTHRLLARFLLRNHIPVDAQTMAAVRQATPHATPSGAKADALVAALSRLPAGQIGQGYHILASTLAAGPASLAGIVQELRNQLTDMASESFNLETKPLDPAQFRAALNEEIGQWDAFLRQGPREQLAQLVERRDLARRFASLIRFNQNLVRVLQHSAVPAQKSMLRLAEQAGASARRALHMLLTDGILSHEDVHQRLHDQGACHSIGVACEGLNLPGRLWVHDRDNPGARILDAENVSVFLRWFTEELGVVEAHLDIQGHELGLEFAAQHAEVARTLDEEKTRVEERLAALGFEARQAPTGIIPDSRPARAEIHNKSAAPVRHFDGKA